MLGRAYNADQLPAAVTQYERFKNGETAAVPDVPFQMLSALPLSRAQWAAIAARASWQTTRMNLNTFARQGVFDVAGMSEMVAARLRDPARSGAGACVSVPVVDGIRERESPGAGSCARCVAGCHENWRYRMCRRSKGKSSCARTCPDR